MIKVKCRCGQSEKSFKFDIGPFFINECCQEAGFDNKGTRQASEEAKSPEQEVKSEKPSLVSKIVDAVLPKSDNKLGKGKLMDMKVADLKAMALEKGIQGAEEMTKKQLVAAILG